MNEDNIFDCSFVSNHYVVCGCGETLEGEEAYRDHLENGHKYCQLPENNDICEINEYVCGTCNKIFNTEDECIEHQNIHIIYVKEESVDEEIINTISIKEDADEDHYIDSSLDIKRYTFVPRSVYSDPTQIIYRVESSVKKEDDEKKRKSVYKNIVCDICQKRYASYAALRYHKRVHSGLRPYACLYCPKKFTMPLFQQIHMRIHTGERPYQCHVCPKAFSNKAALLRHDRVHSGEKPYICPKCGKGFSQSNSLKLHVHTVHMKLPAPYKSRRRREAMLAREARLRGENMPSNQADVTKQEEDSRTKENRSYYDILLV